MWEISKDVITGGELFQINNACGLRERMVILSNPIIIPQTTTATVYSLTVVSPIKINVLIVGYDLATKTYTGMCETTYVFMINGTAVVSANGASGSPEDLTKIKLLDGDFHQGHLHLSIMEAEACIFNLLTMEQKLIILLLEQ